MERIKEYTGTTYLINGASLYSLDILKYQVPYWNEILNKNDVLSTCPLLHTTNLEGSYNTVIQYLHTYGFVNPVEELKQNLRNCRFKYKNFIFITAYKEFEQRLRQGGLKAVYIPMSIDVKNVRQYTAPKTKSNSIIYFGNISDVKIPVFLNLKSQCEYAGMQFDYISYSVLNDNGNLLSREQMLELISSYKYGIGVGRCFQEMCALDIKALIAGRQIGGLITNTLEFQKQLETNMNGRVITFSDKIDECLANLDNTILGTNDITQLNHVEEVLKYYEINNYHS